MSAERRQHPRFRTYKGGRIDLDRGPALDCIIRNLSEGGTCIEVEASLITREHFRLLIRPELVARSCRIVWRRPPRIGAQFI